MKEKKSKKAFTIVELSIIFIVIAAFITFIVIEMASPASTVGEWVKNNIWDTEKAGKDFMTHLPVLIQSIIYVVVIYAVCKLIRIIFHAKILKWVAISYSRGSSQPRN